VSPTAIKPALHKEMAAISARSSTSYSWVILRNQARSVLNFVLNCFIDTTLLSSK
jgi:hypothetical protein